jgi:hypothetical protein
MTWKQLITTHLAPFSAPLPLLLPLPLPLQLAS